MANNNASRKLRKHCEDFIKKHNITCSETIYQTDRVIENAHEFVEGVCDIVGYAASAEAEISIG